MSTINMMNWGRETPQLIPGMKENLTSEQTQRVIEKVSKRKLDIASNVTVAGGTVAFLKGAFPMNKKPESEDVTERKAEEAFKKFSEAVEESERRVIFEEYAKELFMDRDGHIINTPIVRDKISSLESKTGEADKRLFDATYDFYSYSECSIV